MYWTTRKESCACFSNKQAGFSLIELMIVVSIVGILSSVAIPMFSQYRMKAFNASAKSHIKSVAVTENVLFDEDGTYQIVPFGIGPGSMGTLPNENAPTDVCFVVHVPDSSHFTAYLAHRLGDTIFAVSESVGPLWKKATSGVSPCDEIPNEPADILTEAWGSH